MPTDAEPVIRPAARDESDAVAELLWAVREQSLASGSIPKGIHPLDDMRVTMHNRDAMAAGDFSGARHGGGIVAVDMQDARARDHFVGDFLGAHLEAFVPPPQDGTLARGAVDDDVGGLIGTALADQQMIEIDAGAAKAIHLYAAAQVVAHGADVLGAQSQAGTGDKGAGHLAAGAEVFFLEWHLAGIRRKMRNNQQGVGRIEPHSNNIEFRHGRDYCKGSAPHPASFLRGPQLVW